MGEGAKLFGTYKIIEKIVFTYKYAGATQKYC